MPDTNKYTVLWYARFNHAEDIALHKLREWAFSKDFIEKNTKYGILKFLVMNTFYDYIGDAEKKWIYSEEELIELIDSHNKLKEKFEAMLKGILEAKESRREEIIDAIAD